MTKCGRNIGVLYVTSAMFVRKIWKKCVRFSVSVSVLVIFTVLFLHMSVREPFLNIFHSKGGNHIDSVKYLHDADIDRYTSQLICGVGPDVLPVNGYDFPYLIPNKEKCLNANGCRVSIRLLIIVKSSAKNFQLRNAVRQTWGWEQRFPDTVIRCVFNLGFPLDNPSIQLRIEEEQRKFGDIIQGNFTDAYRNTTIKTMMGFRWVVENCSTAKFVLFADDDMYVSTKNVLRFINRPIDYPRYLLRNLSTKVELKQKNQPFTFDLNEPPTHFFAGRVKFNEGPVRDKACKWYISFTEYPFPIYPPYVPAGAFILSYQTLRRMYFTSMYTPHFPFDDVYIGMLAMRAGIALHHNREFTYKNKPNEFEYVIANHGYDNYKALTSFWDKQYKLQHA